MQTSFTQTRLRSAFALPAVLLLSTGVLILLVMLMTIVALERSTSKARAGAYQADLAVESGFEEAKMILARATASDTFAVGVIPFAVEYDDNDDGSISSDEDGNLRVADGERGRPYLYAIQGEVDQGDVSYRMTPLFATHDGPDMQQVGSDGVLSMPSEPGVSLEAENNLESHVAVRGTPHLQAPVTAWRTIRDEDGVPIARYSYWVEDMQGYLDAELAGGNDRNGGAHARANELWKEQSGSWNPAVEPLVANYLDEGGQVPLWPAPGINPNYVKEEGVAASAGNSPLSEVAVYTLDQDAEGVVDVSEFDDTIRELASKAPTPASLLALSGVQAPLERVPNGVDRGRMVLENRSGSPEPRWIEENFVTGNQSWEEFALIPFTPGLDPSVMGELRMNLNEKLEELKGTTAADGATVQQGGVQEIADHIAEALPSFASQRRGGFGDWEEEDDPDAAYLKTIAASIIDYADTDDVPTMLEGEYRGLDSHPLITEYAMTMTFEWTSHPDDAPSGYEGEWIFRTQSDTYLLFTIEHFAELWNMTNQPISGSAQFRYENSYTTNALFEELLFDGDVLDNQAGPGSGRSWSVHTMVKDPTDDVYYTAPQEIELLPNEYKLVRTGGVRFGLRIGDRSAFLPPNKDGDPAVFSLREVEDNKGYRLKWNDVVSDRSGGSVERRTIGEIVRREVETNAQVCGTWGFLGDFYTGMQDVRQSWWAGRNQSDGPVSENSYPQNFTPGRRNVRYGSLGGSPQLQYARVLPSEWPDGGHNSDFDVKGFRELTFSRLATSTRPDDPRFIRMKLDAEPALSPMFVSNLGRFISETELGNIFDPIMWKGRANPSSDSLETWPYQELDFSDEPQVSERATKSIHVGGGNTLRIGRPEHEKFTEQLGTRASRMLDLFHCGDSLSLDATERTGKIRTVEGHININTASREVLRTLAAGLLSTDPEVARESSSFDSSGKYAPRLTNILGEISATDVANSGSGATDEAGLVADAIIATRPFVSRSQLADLIYSEDTPNEELREKPVFGNKLNHSAGERLQRTDRAAEEVFARVYNSSTVRSRNFRVHVIGEALEQTPSGNLRVKATRKKSYRVFVDADGRNVQLGEIQPEAIKVKTLYETNL